MLTREQEEFFRLFEMNPPAGMSAGGARRFMEAYLRDGERLRRWQQRDGARPVAAAPPATAPAAAPAPAAPQAPPPARPTGIAPPAPPPIVPQRSPERHGPNVHVERNFHFTGSGGEYFGIWIVNLLLTMLTLGIYSAWAKVRRLQYFYRHTEVAGASFDYHGEPIAILKGRAIALVLFLLYNFSFQLSPALGFATVVLLAVALPWLLRNSFRFRLRNSSYRGLRFRFAGTPRDAYLTFLLRPLITLVTLYLAAPWFHHGLKRYQHGNSLYGSTPFAFGASVGQFYREYLIIGLLMALVLAVPASMLVGALGEMARLAQESGAPPDPQLFVGTIFTAVALLMAGMLAITPLFQARLQNLVWNGTTLGPHRFESTLSAWQLFLIHLTNALLIVVTFGFFTPWAAVRVARCRVEALGIVADGSLEDFVASQAQDVGAAGEETAELFDIDIAL